MKKSDVRAAIATLDKHVPGWKFQDEISIAAQAEDGVWLQIGSHIKGGDHAIINAAEFINHVITDNGTLIL